MADNIKSLRLRMQTIEKVSKITNAMKLISIAKMQTYQQKIREFETILTEFEAIPVQERSGVKQAEKLAIVFVPDLGMASKYLQVITQALASSDITKLYWIGHQWYERVVDNEQWQVINPSISSDSINLTSLYDELLDLMAEYRIVVAISQMEKEELSVEWHYLNVELREAYDIIYEPNYIEANERFQSYYILLTIYQAYYLSKLNENVIRRLAMDQATQSAEDMQESLRMRYNQLRQEKITLEILELAGGDSHE